MKIKVITVNGKSRTIIKKQNIDKKESLKKALP